MMKASSNTLCLWICKINQELVIVLPTDNNIKELFSFITEIIIVIPDFRLTLSFATSSSSRVDSSPSRESDTLVRFVLSKIKGKTTH